MARSLDDLIGKILAVEGVDYAGHGRLDLRAADGVSLTPTSVLGSPGQPTTLRIEIGRDTSPEFIATASGTTTSFLLELAPLSLLGGIPLALNRTYIFTVILDLTTELGTKSIAELKVVAWNDDGIVGANDPTAITVLEGDGETYAWDTVGSFAVDVDAGEVSLEVSVDLTTYAQEANVSVYVSEYNFATTVAPSE